jgi:hypothetical protein
MNARIRELAEQARKYARDYVADCKHYGHYMEHNELEVKFEQKFAELIVRECQTVVEWAISVDSTIDRVPVLINEHFGVEE